MTFSTLQRSLIPAAALAGTVFATVTLPLALMPSEHVVIEFQNEPVFTGRLDEMAVPYLGLATALSMGVGLTSMAVMGWQQSASKSAQIEKQVSQLQQDLQQKEAQLDQLKFSEERLGEAKLDFFLKDENSKEPLQETSNHALAAPQPPVEAIATTDAVLQKLAEQYLAQASAVALASQKVEAPAKAASSVSGQTSQPWMLEAMETAPPIGLAQEVEENQARLRAMTAFPAAQAFNSFKRTSNSPEAGVSSPAAQAQPTEDTSAQLNELLDYLKQMMTEVERFKTTTPSTMVSQSA